MRRRHNLWHIELAFGEQARRDTITLRNGDDSLTHHAFIEADRFSFDAGDQEPGAETRLTLTEPGDFVIQCGIHPKMKLTIHVQ